MDPTAEAPVRSEDWAALFMAALAPPVETSALDQGGARLVSGPHSVELHAGTVTAGDLTLRDSVAEGRPCADARSPSPPAMGVDAGG